MSVVTHLSFQCVFLSFVSLFFLHYFTFLFLSLICSFGIYFISLYIFFSFLFFCISFFLFLSLVCYIGFFIPFFFLFCFLFNSFFFLYFWFFLNQLLYPSACFHPTFYFFLGLLFTFKFDTCVLMLLNCFNIVKFFLSFCTMSIQQLSKIVFHIPFKAALLTRSADIK